MKQLTTLSILLLISAFPLSVFGDVRFEVSASLASVDLENTQVNGPDFEDSFDAGMVSLGAYRKVSEYIYVGSAIERIIPFSRDSEVGSGEITAFRGAGVKYVWSNRLMSEFYFGAAMYEWERKADGLYYGTSLTYRILGQRTHLLADLRFYNDLNYDNAFGDLVASGFQPSFGLSFSF